MAQFRKNYSEEKINFFGLFNCSKDKIIGRFFQKCLDTSITGKLIGMLVVSLLGVVLIIVLNVTTLKYIASHNDMIRDISIPQYKVTQYILRSINGFKISLLHIMSVEEIHSGDRNVIANQQRLVDMERMVLSLRKGGPILDVAKVSRKTLDVFNAEPSNDPQMSELLDLIYAEYVILNEAHQNFIDCLIRNGTDEERDDLLEELLDNLDEVYKLVIEMTVYINKYHSKEFKAMGNTIRSSTFRSIWLGILIALILTIATILYILVIVYPLRNILEKITFIAKGEGDRAQFIDVKSNDEVGQLATQLNTLVDNIFSLNTFKAVIEEEETATEVNRRLASLICERYGCHRLFIYEVTSNKNTMSIAYASNYEEHCRVEMWDDSNHCRAKRTGHPISSFEFPDICKQFSQSEKLMHYCIPMIANGMVVGVVQFLLDKNSSMEEVHDFFEKVNRASRYVKEATPVIEAKRFASALQETTMKDPLTDLYNRRFLESYSETLVATTVRQGGRVGIIMCDMDFFKEVNDTYGHETGDIVLIKTAEVLKNCVRASDIVVRYGGEEFIVLLIDVLSRDDIVEIAEKIRGTMERTVISFPEGSLKKTLSIGMSEFPEDTAAFWEAIKFADVALYRAKEEGRNRVVSFCSGMWKEEKY